MSGFTPRYWEVFNVYEALPRQGSGNRTPVARARLR
jgi:hypothetical protein